MRLLKFPPRFLEPEKLTTERLVIRRPILQDFQAWAQLRHQSQDFLRPYEPTWAEDELSRLSFRTRLRRHESEINAGQSLPWFLFDLQTPSNILGGLTISNIRRGVAETGTLGYWMGEPYAGQGYMSEAVTAVCDHLLNSNHLHRIEAATVLDNERSQKLLQKCGFSHEGTAKAYLKINGQWRDHHLYAKLKKDEKYQAEN